VTVVPSYDGAEIKFKCCVVGHSSGVIGEEFAMTNLLENAISADDGDWAAKLIQNALGIECDDVANHCFPKTWPQDREQRARIFGDWLRAEVRYLA
jgi:hypothetical protein